MCNECKWQDVSDLIDAMAKDPEGRWAWAEETLEGIDGWLVDNEHVTPRQRSAVQNIHQAGLREKPDKWKKKGKA